MIIAIRIAGQIGLAHEIKETLFRLRLRRKYTAVILLPTAHNKKLLQSVRNFVAYGSIDEETLKLLIEKRVRSKKVVDSEEIVAQINQKSLDELGVKPFFRLHPPRGGIDAKKHAGIGKGVLGDNKEKINELVRRML